MSYEHTLKNITLPAGSDLSAGQYKLVKLASDGQIDLVGTKGAVATGVLQDKPDAAGRVGAVAVSGITKLKITGTIAIGGEVIASATGTGVPQDGVSQNVIGEAITGGVTGDTIAVLLKSYLKPSS